MKENTEKSQKLTKEHCDLIEKNLKDIKRLLGYYIFKNKNFLWLGSLQALTDEGLSHLPEVSLEWKPELANTLTFTRFAAERCLLRLIDEYRRHDSHVKAKRRRYAITSDIKDRLLQEQGHASEEEIEKELEDRGYRPSHKGSKYLGVYNSTKVEQSPFDMAGRTFVNIDPELENVDWTDLKKKLLKSADEAFSEKNQYVYKLLLTDHLIPKAEGQEFKTLSSIGQEVDLSEGRLSQMIHSDKMKGFVNSLYKRNYD